MCLAPPSIELFSATPSFMKDVSESTPRAPSLIPLEGAAQPATAFPPAAAANLGAHKERGDDDPPKLLRNEPSLEFRVPKGNDAEGKAGSSGEGYGRAEQWRGL